ncbi:hypothetical protein J4208_02660 [Candidatus Woesearchaeota archaeon]|nr:hypothetical protein [Candidatus Woesearchaeota archaeon]
MLFKKGALELQYVILFILAILVLLVLSVMFREQVSNFFNTIFSISKEINQSRPPIKDIIGP